MAWNYQRSPRPFAPAPVHASLATPARRLEPAVALQRAVSAQGPQAAEILALQRSVGNRAVQRLLARLEPAGNFGARDTNGVAADADIAVDRAAGTSGQALPTEVRSRFEDSLGADLSGVRIHTGKESAQAAAAVGAKAYTVGQDIHFGAGYYAPDDSEGIHLLAHEVAHTVQNGGPAPARRDKLEVSNPGDAAEIEADRAADAIVARAPASIREEDTR